MTITGKYIGAGGLLAALITLPLGASAAVVPASISLSAPTGYATTSGTLATDNQVALIHFNLAAPGTSAVSFETFSYAGGTMRDGTKVARGGFDPVVSLFDNDGVMVKFNDDTPLGGRMDSITSRSSDSRLDITLKSGSYTVAVSQFSNFPDYLLTDNFHSDNPTFTSDFGCSNGRFCDGAGTNRTGDYALQVSVAPIPVPAALPLLLSGIAALGGLGLMRRRRDPA